MPLVFSTEAKQKLRETVARYPSAMAATLPALHLAQAEFGHVSDEAIEAVASELGLSPAHVYGVATFYTMYNKRPVGTYHVQVCTNVSCMLDGGYDCLRVAQAAASVAPETFTVSEVECLASCGTAVCVQVNDDYHEQMNVQRLEALLGELGRRG
ncbi:MAG: NAD(P)H-dependent oxidoreductase subunit E [Myxococcota bacterium]